MKPFLGIIAGLIVIIGTVPYLRDILSRKTKPSRATWGLLTALLLITVFVQGELDTGWARALTISEVIACGSVFLLSLKYGVGGTDRTDKICYLIWAFMVICWLVLDKPLLALHFAVLADLVALIPTFIKSWKTPKEESINVFAASSLSGLIAIFAAETYVYSTILFPLYLFIVNLLIVTLLIASNRKTTSFKGLSPN
jgi:hypothetical protein